MASRREERLPLRLAATVWGMQEDGTLFVDQVRTNDISRMGARLTGFTHPVQVGMLLGIQQGTSTGRFRVVWVGQMGTAESNQVGLFALNQAKNIWNVKLPDTLDPQPARPTRKKKK